MTAALAAFRGRLAVPQAGRTIASSVVPLAEPLARTFGTLLRAVSHSGNEETVVQRYRATFSPMVPIASASVPPRALEIRLAISALLCEWLLARLAGPPDRDLSLEDAELWFLRDMHKLAPGVVLGNTDWIPPSCLADLDGRPFNQEFVDLLPYVLEVFESVQSDGVLPGRAAKRTRQRAEGVVYTPSDVADFIVRETLAPWLNENAGLELPACLDPACGTGLFMRSALLQLVTSRRDSKSIWDIVQSLYGMDISHQAIQSCAFVLLADCLLACGNTPVAPWRIWHAIRANLAVVDSTLVSPSRSASPEPEILGRLRARLRRDLLQESPDPPAPRGDGKDNHLLGIGWRITEQAASNFSGPQSLHLHDIFPEVGEGFSAIFGNPPYSRLPHDGNEGMRAARFATAPAWSADQTWSLYPLFLEMMWHFARPGASTGGMVVPMSIAYSRRSQIERLRSTIQQVSGKWRFAFFDRTPDSLFGDDAKTRNCIVLWCRNSTAEQAEFWTGPFLRWSSRNRENLFGKVGFVHLGGVTIRSLIPKLGSPLEREVYLHLRSTGRSLASLVREVPASALTLGLRDPRLVLFTVTAYNWIPTFRQTPLSRDKDGAPSVAPSLRAVACLTEEEASFVFASLNSRLTYWLWRVEGDGFHVSHEFIRGLPFHPSFSPLGDRAELRRLAEELWIGMQQHPVESVNGGRATTSYYPHACQSALDTIDALLLKNLGLPNEFLVFLRDFVIENMVAGRRDELETNPALRRIKLMEGDDE